MLCHLADSFRVTNGEKPGKIARISVAPIALPRRFVKWGALDPPMAWPGSTQTVPKSTRN